MADGLQIEQLFQNLIRNALKFRSKAPPRVHVSAEHNETEWVFSVQDNGLGVDPALAENIFHIFRRMPRNRGYSGLTRTIAPVASSLVILSRGLRYPAKSSSRTW